jgi:hypothetical protein
LRELSPQGKRIVTGKSEASLIRRINPVSPLAKDANQTHFAFGGRSGEDLAGEIFSVASKSVPGPLNSRR